MPILGLDQQSYAILNILHELEPATQTGILVGCILMCVNDSGMDKATADAEIEAIAKNLTGGWQKLSQMMGR